MYILFVADDKINEMKMQKENMERVTKMVAKEVQALKTQCDRERETAKIMKLEADKVNGATHILSFLFIYPLCFLQSNEFYISTRIKLLNPLI